jgi:hypothetical protein
LEESLPHLAQIFGGVGVSLIKPQIVHCHLGALGITRSFGSEEIVCRIQGGLSGPPTSVSVNMLPEK